MENMIGESAGGRIAGAAASDMRRAIRETGGREVFFAGELDAGGQIRSVRVLARGHETAVTAVFDGLANREAVVHNHPSGDIAPSDADLNLAALYSRNGHGVYIVDNEVERVYVVAEPVQREPRELIDETVVESFFGPAGVLAANLPDFEYRVQQVETCRHVVDAFNGDSIAVIEAPTGVGKTLAYLLPAVLWSLANRERVVISTRTINLQEQIIDKDIPLLQRCLDREFNAVLVKGRSNYLCPRRLDQALAEALLFGDGAEQDQFRKIADWAANSEDGSTSDLPFVPDRNVWERVCSEADICTAAQCRAAGNCFVPKARRKIIAADVLVVNHHLLFSDLAIKNQQDHFSAPAVLPAFSRIVIDEAHHIEDSASQHFGSTATKAGFRALMGRLMREERGQIRGLFPILRRRLEGRVDGASLEELDNAMNALNNGAVPAVVAARDSAEASFSALRSLASAKCRDIGREVKWRLTPEALSDPGLRQYHDEYALPAAEDIAELAKQLTRLHEALAAINPPFDTTEHPFGEEIAQLRGYADRLRRIVEMIAEGTSDRVAENMVRWVEISADDDRILRLVKTPVRPGEILAQWVYPNLRTTIMTSATLTVATDFGFFLDRSGVNEGKTSGDTLMLPSPFNFEQQAMLCIADDAPSPNAPAFTAYLAHHVRETVIAIGGHTFVLFTSFQMLNAVFDRIETDLVHAGIHGLRQGDDTRTRLLATFKQSENAVLFAVDSFWEGVDIAGTSLLCVIVPRLPFPVPSEPVLQARAQAIERDGGNAFMDYMVPLAVTRLRQGFGRLIRRRTDFGAVVILDSRIIQKRYGRIFLDSLPPACRVVTRGGSIAGEVQRFLHNQRASTPA